LPKIAIDELKKHYDEYLQLKSQKGDKWNALDLVVYSRKGTPVDHKNFWRGFKQAAQQVGLPEIRFHDTRHSHSTLLLKKNVHPKLVQERLGHSRITITLDTYSHVLPSMQKEVADTLDSILETSN
jgi:integrase